MIDFEISMKATAIVDRLLQHEAYEHCANITEKYAFGNKVLGIADKLENEEINFEQFLELINEAKAQYYVK